MKSKRKNSARSRKWLWLLVLLVGLGGFIVWQRVGWQASPDDPLRLSWISGGRFYQIDFVTGEQEFGGVTQRLAVPKAPSPDGHYMAEWHHIEDGKEWFLLIRDLRTGKSHRLRKHEVGYPSLAWSPDSKWLAFGASNATAAMPEDMELFITNIETGITEQLTHNDFRDDSPVFSPDGSQLAYTSASDGFNRLYVMDIATREVRLLSPTTFGYTPSWSPDGTYIAFMSDHLDPVGDIYMIKPDGTELLQISHTIARDEYPVWTPATCVDGYCYTQYGKAD